MKNNTVSQNNSVALKNIPVPRTQKNVRQFLGKINCYEKYVPNISIILNPSQYLLGKGQKLYWCEKCGESSERLKDSLCSKPILTIFDPNLPRHIYTDASILEIGAV